MITLDSLNIETLSPQELGEILIEAKKAYYTGGKPIMDDHTYDTLEDILRQKAPYHRLFSKVGHPNFDTGFIKKKHTMTMGSQNKVNSLPDLVHYFKLKKVPLSSKGVPEGQGIFVVQPKCDGISLEIIYKNGELIEAITRGDGEIGDVITQNIVQMKNFIPNPVLSKVEGACPEPVEGFTGSIRCEIVVTKKDFEKLNQLSEEKYSNPRNAASGLSQRLDSKYADYCSLYAVDISPSPPAESEKIDLLNSLGFTAVESVLCQNFDEIEAIYQQFLNHKRLSYPYDIDGLVVKLNDLSLAKVLGFKNNRPKFQVAYKFPASSNTTQIKSVTWQVGPLGTITPVANIEPVEISGAIITFASLANHNLIIEKNLNVGDIVEISRRGDVIPHIEKVVTKVNSGHIDIPQFCPSCHTKLIKDDKFLRCPNSTGCLGQILGSLRLFCDTLGILGLSDKTIGKLYQANRIRLPGDFFKLRPVDISDLENLGDKSAKSIINQIQSKKVLSVVEIFDAAIIPNFSAQRIQQVIAAGYDTPEKLLNISQKDLESLPGFQKTLAGKVWQGIQLRRPWIKSILTQVTIHKSYFINHKSLSGLSFCITGDLSHPRKDIENQIISLGGKVLSTVTSNTSYLICNSKSNSDKYQKALKLNIPIITESDYTKLANNT